MQREQLKDQMIEECIGEYMAKMQNKYECVRHMAFTAAEGTSVTDLSNQCDNMNTRFLRSDARDLCIGLTNVHSHFWPRFQTPQFL